MLAMDLLQANIHFEAALNGLHNAPGTHSAHDRQKGCSVTQLQNNSLLPQQQLQWLQQTKQRPFAQSGRSNSGSSTFSSDPAIDPALGDIAELLPPSAQLHLQLHTEPALSRDPSCQSNELGRLLDSSIITEQQLQQQFRQHPSLGGLPPQPPALVPFMLPGQLLMQQAQQEQPLPQEQLSDGGQHSLPGGNMFAHKGSLQHADAAAFGGAAVQPSPANSSQTPAAAAEEEQLTDGGKYSLPVVALKVACGDMVGTLLVHKARICIYEGTDKQKEVSPTEFERLGGRSATKKWKQSIRLIGEDGNRNGRPVGEWYVQMGLEAPKKPRDKDIHNPASPVANVYLDRHERHKTATATAAAAAAAAAATTVLPTPRARALRATRHAHAAHKHAGRKGRGGGEDDAAAGGSSWDEGAAGASAADGVDGAAAAGAAAAGLSPSGMFTTDGAAMGVWGAPYQQHGVTPAAASLAGTSGLHFQAGANPLALSTSGRLAAAEGSGGTGPLDTAAVDWAQQQQQMDATATIPAAAAAAAYAAAVSGDYVVVPLAAGQAGLPGDTSLAVVEMGAYLQGLRSTPPWRLLPINQRPLVGRQLVPLRQLFIMMLHMGGYHNLEGDERLWQEIAIQLELPAWPSPEVPDPIRVLQQVYKDYLLRFETRFVLQQASSEGNGNAPAAVVAPLAGGVLPQATPLQGLGAAGPGAAGAGGVGSGGGSGGLPVVVGRQDHSPALSKATTQYNAAAGAAGGGGVGTRLPSVHTALNTFTAGADTTASAAAAAATATAAGSVRGPQHLLLPGQPLQTAVSGIGDMFLDRSLSGDILDALVDLIPLPADMQPTTAAAALPREAAVGSGSSGSGSGNGSSAPERPGSLTLMQAMAAQELAARLGRAPPVPPPGPAAAGAAAGSGGIGVAGTAGVSRQHPEMAQVLRRRQQQQLLQQLQVMASEVTAGAFAGGAGAAGGASARLKRPAPLVRCGDSDVVNHMDQVDVERILREHEEHQAAVLVAARQAGVQPTAGQQQQAGGGSGAAARTGGAEAAAGVLAGEGVDADMQEMLEGYLQHGADPAQQQPLPPQQQQQAQQRLETSGSGGSSQGRPQAEDGVSGMLEALQIEAQQQQQQQGQQQQQRAAGPLHPPGLPPLQHQGTMEFLPQQYKLHMQQSVGAHLMSDLLSQQAVVTGGNASATAGAAGLSSSGGPPPALGTGTAAGQQQKQAAPLQEPQQPQGAATDQRREQQPDDGALPAFAGGLLRLTTPNSALLGSVLESPTHRAAAAGQWLDMAGPAGSSAPLEGPAAQQQQGQQQQLQPQATFGTGPAAEGDDLSRLMNMW